MSDATKIAAAASSKDPAVGLSAVTALRGLLESLEELQVANALARLVLAAGRRGVAGEPTGSAQEVPQIRILSERESDVRTVHRRSPAGRGPRAGTCPRARCG
ncbi:MAG: hypothetical protein ACR2FL_04990, partial [Nocardioidaceae bacterium]